MSGTTESNILSRVPGLEDDSSDNTQQDTSQDQDQGSSDEGDYSPTAPLDGVAGSGSRKDASGKPVAEQPPVVRRHDGLVERQSQADPRHRDLVDPVTGQIVAHGGIERRVFETAQRTTRENQRLKEQLQQAETRSRTLTETNQLGTQLGLSPEHQTTAMRVMADFMRDPVRTVEYMIAEVKSKGYTIPALEGQGQATDMAAFQRMLDERLRPLTEERMQQQRVQQAEVQARRELDNFLEQEPDARSNLDVIASMLQQDQGLTLPNAYIRLLRWCGQNGYDPSQPLQPQIQARQSASVTPGPQPRQPRPLPNGRTMSNGAAPVGDRRMFDENSEWTSIIDASMREAGFNR